MNEKRSRAEAAAPDSQATEAARVGSLFLGGGGVAALAAAFTIARYPMPGWSAGRLALLSSVAILTSVVVYQRAHRISLFVMQVIVVAAAVYIGIGQVLATAGGQNFGPVLMLWPVLWAYTYLPPRQAHRIAVACAAILGVVFAVQDGWTTPAVSAVFLACTFVVTAMTMTGLVHRAEAAASRERKASHQLQVLNSTLEDRVAEQVDELARLSRLRRFLSPQVAEAVLRADDESALGFHRQEIAVAFIDLRGFTSFAAAAEPEEVTEVLRSYHAEVGALVDAYSATVGAFAGDGVMLFFNDPIPCDDPTGRAVQLLLDLRRPMADLAARWARRGHSIGYGAGVALGFATLGMTGFSSRSEYTAIGSVVNLAARLCDEAAPSEVLLDARANAAVEGRFPTEHCGERSLKGLAHPVSVHRIIEVDGALATPRVPPVGVEPTLKRV